MKILKFSAVLVIILLFALIAYSSSIDITIKEEDEETRRADVTKENVSEVINNGGSILEFNGYVYYLNMKNSSGEGFSNKICRKKLEENSEEEVIYDANQYRIDDRLMIFNNNLFFSIVGQTSYINLEDLKTLQSYNKGILYSIQNGKIIYAYQGKVYRGEYYPATLAIRTIEPIATVSPNFLLEDDNNLYFYGNNDDGSKSIFSVNKESQSLNILDRIYLGDATKIDIVDYTQSDDDIYLAIEKNMGNNLKEYTLRKISKDRSNFESITLNENFERFVGATKENVYYELKNSGIFYKYNVNKNEVEKLENNEADENIYTLKLNGKNVELYNKNELFATILRSIDYSVSNIKIEEIGEYIYLKFDLVDSKNNLEEYNFWRLKKDGSNLERLNNTF